MKNIIIFILLVSCVILVATGLGVFSQQSPKSSKYDIQSIISCVNQQDCFDVARITCRGDWIGAAPQFVVNKDGAKYYLTFVCKR